MPYDWRTCPWQICQAYEYCSDAPTAEKMKAMRHCIMHKCGDAMFGLFYIPPGIYYPSHLHKPPEMYYVLQGEANFFMADQSGVPDPDVHVQAEAGGSGSFWLHQPYQAHGLQTLNKALLPLGSRTWSMSSVF